MAVTFTATTVTNPTGAQGSYPLREVVGHEGMLADLQAYVCRSYRNQSGAAIPFGVLVQTDNSPTSNDALAVKIAEDFKFDGVDDETLYAQAFENLTGSAPREDAEPAYIHGVVDGILAARSDTEDEEGESPEDEGEEPETKEDRADSTTSLRDALKGAGRNSASPVASYRARQAEAWKRPLTATK